MRTLAGLSLILILLFPTRVFAELKYGFIAASDEALLAKVHDPGMAAVILGCVYKIDPSPDPPKLLHISHVTVIESYKGPLVVGQKVVIVIAAEGGPTKEEELGRLRFFFLRKCRNGYAPKGAYCCEGIDTAQYGMDRAQDMMNLLRKNIK